MTLQVSQSMPSNALTTPTALTPAASDTIADTSFGPNGCFARIITTTTATNVTIVDPNYSAMANLGVSAALACPATGSRLLPIPRAAINPATGLATLTFSAVTGVTYELIRY